jgi:3-hydroxyisobutyrate dehydrogenase
MARASGRPNVVARLEEATGVKVAGRRASRAEILDDEPEEPGYEVVPKGRG